VLARHGVDFVLIGGVAAVALGAPAVTFDLVLVPERSEANLTRLTAALIELEASVKAAGRVRRHPDGQWLLAGKVWNFETQIGDVDVIFAPPGVAGYEQLVEQATDVDVGDGMIARVASLDDLIAMKEAANRPKDQLILPILRWLRDRSASDLEANPGRESS